MKIINTTNQSSYQNEAVGYIIQKIEQLRKEKTEITIALPGGRSILPVLTELSQQNSFNFRGLNFFSLDERIVPVVDNLSNNYYLHEIFFKKMVDSGKILKDQVHLFHPRGKLKDYAIHLEKFGNIFDIAILGVGEDGHIAALFPNHESLELEGPIYGDYQSSPKFPPMRMSATLEMIKKSRHALVLFYGKTKKDAYNKFMNEELSTSNLPVNIVKEMADVQVITCLSEE